MALEHCSFFDRCPGGAHLFWDAEQLDGHDGAVRDGILELLGTHRKQWTTIHVLFRSALIGVTVSAANLVLGGPIRAYRRRPEFRAAVEGALSSP